MNGIRRRLAAMLLAAAAGGAAAAGPVRAQVDFDRARDRGAGIPISMFGTYIAPRQLIVYSYGEYYRDSDAEYKPMELGYGLDQDFRGEYRALEGLLFVAYGISNHLAVEFEAAVITATLDKSAEDPTLQPARLQESGLGDVEAQLRWRWQTESAARPEIFSYFETVFPFQKNRRLIGTQNWEFVLGTGITRGFRWGTMTARLAAEYDGAEGVLEPGEFALEYLKRISPGLRVYLAVEGAQDEIELIPEAQLFLRPNVVLKLNSALGLTSKATGWAPEVGLMFFFR